MSVPQSVEALTTASELLAAVDRAEVKKWDEGEEEIRTQALRNDPWLAEDDLPVKEEFPLVVRVAHLGSVFAERAAEMTREERRRVLAAAERVLVTGGDSDRAAVATGFLESVQHAAGRTGFDLQLIWDDMGTESQAYCLLMDKRWGIESTEWMRRSDGGVDQEGQSQT